MSKLQFSIKIHNQSKDQTFEQKMYVNQTTSGEIALEQIVKELGNYNLEYDLENMFVIIGNLRNPHETFIVIERCK